MNWDFVTILVKGDIENFLPLKMIRYTIQNSGNLRTNVLYQDHKNMNHFITSKEEDEIPILIGPGIIF